MQPNDRTDHLLLTPENEDVAPYELPLPREVSGLEHYVPAYLNVPVSFRHFKVGNKTNMACIAYPTTCGDYLLMWLGLRASCGVRDVLCNFAGRADIVVLFCGFPLVSIINFSNTLMFRISARVR